MIHLRGIVYNMTNEDVLNKLAKPCDWEEGHVWSRDLSARIWFCEFCTAEVSDKAVMVFQSSKPGLIEVPLDHLD